MPMNNRLLRPQNNFNPASVSGGAVWLDFSRSDGVFQLSSASTAVAADGDPIGYVPNRFTSGTLPAIQASTNNRPTYKAGIRNGRSVARFDGLNDSFVISSLPLDATITVFVVAQFDTAGTAGNAAGNLFIEHSANATSNNGFAFQGQSSATGVINRTGVPSFKRASVGVADWLGTSWAVSEFRIAGGATANDVFTCRKNGTEQADNGDVVGGGFNSGTITSGREATADLFIGSRNQASVFSDGDFGEILIYNRALADAEMSYIRRGLGSKWGVTVT